MHVATKRLHATVSAAINGICREEQSCEDGVSQMVAGGFDGQTLAPLCAANQADAFDFQQSSGMSVSAGCLGPIDYPSLAQACTSRSDAQIALHAKTQPAAQQLGNAQSPADEMSDISSCETSATSCSAFVAPASSFGGAHTAVQAISSGKCVSPPPHLLAARPGMTLLQELRTETQKEVEFLESLLLQFTHRDVGEEYMPQGGTAYIGEPIQGDELQVSQLAPTSAIGNPTLDEVAVLQDAMLQISMASNVPANCTLSAQQSKDDQQQQFDDLEQQAVLLESQKTQVVSEAAYAQPPSSGMPFAEPGTSVPSSQQSLEPTICPCPVEVAATTAQLSIAGGLDVGKTSSLQVALEAAQRQLALAVQSQEQLAALISQMFSFDMPHLVSTQRPLEAIRTQDRVLASTSHQYCSETLEGDMQAFTSTCVEDEAYKQPLTMAYGDTESESFLRLKALQQDVAGNTLDKVDTVLSHVGNEVDAQLQQVINGPQDKVVAPGLPSLEPFEEAIVDTFLLSVKDEPAASAVPSADVPTQDGPLQDTPLDLPSPQAQSASRHLSKKVIIASPAAAPLQGVVNLCLRVQPVVAQLLADPSIGFQDFEAYSLPLWARLELADYARVMSVHQTSGCEPGLLTAPSLWWFCAGMSSPTREVLGGDTVQRLITETNQDYPQATLPLCLPPIATQEIEQWFLFIVELVADWRRLAAFLWGPPLETNVPAVVASFGITWQQLFADPQSALSRLQSKLQRVELYFDQVAKQRVEVQEQLQALADQGKLDPLIVESWENFTTYMVEQAMQLLHPVAQAIQLRLEHDPTLEHWCAGWGCTANLAMDFDAPTVGTIDLPEVLAAASATMSATVSVDASDDSSASLTPSISVASDASPADFLAPSQSVQAFESTPFLGNVKQTDVEAAVDLAIQAPSSCFADGAATDLAISGKGVVPTSKDSLAYESCQPVAVQPYLGKSHTKLTDWDAVIAHQFGSLPCADDKQVANNALGTEDACLSLNRVQLEELEMPQIPSLLPPCIQETLYKMSQQTTLQAEGICLPAHSRMQLRDLCSRRDQMRQAPQAHQREELQYLVWKLKSLLEQQGYLPRETYLIARAFMLNRQSSLDTETLIARTLLARDHQHKQTEPLVQALAKVGIDVTRLSKQPKQRSSQKSSLPFWRI